ncbi:MAG: AAA family ATPase [Catenulisporales bacterium]|nr:AAA family ATPase [Catenulisporales bacterium]
MSAEATFIWGPPGTGKTDVVARIVEGCHRLGQTVLFLAPTHIAVDQALLRICGLLESEPGFEAGLVQRSGEMAVAALKEKFGDRVDTDLIVARLSAELAERIASMERALKEVCAGVASHREALRLNAELESLRSRLRQAEEQVAVTGETIRVNDAKRYGAKAEIARIGEPSGLMANRKAKQLDGLRLGLQTLEAAWATASAHHQAWKDEAADAQRTISDIELKLPFAAALVKDIEPLAVLLRREEEMKRKLTAWEDERRAVTDSVRSCCRVLGATVAKAVQSRKLMDRVDVVVIDEAGMVDLPSAWLAAGLATRRIVVAGDFRQLPAITKGSGSRRAKPAERSLSAEWTNRDAFHAAGLVDDSGRARLGDARLVVLDTQYRMRPAICGLVNKVAYPDAPLTTGRSDGSGLPRSPLIERAIVLIDTSGRCLDGRDHKSNPVHEAVIHELIRGLQYDGVLPGRKHPRAAESAAARMAIIAPYKNQTRALTSSLKYRFGDEYEDLVDTVHRFQGSERGIVVLDTVAGIGKSIGYFWEHTGLTSTTCRLLNVAVSRARDHLVVVADVDFLSRKLPPGSEVSVMLEHLRGDPGVQHLSVDELVPIRSAADLHGLNADELARPAFFPADEVRRAVEWDIERAERRIDIYCAFLSPVPVRRWAKRLAARVAAGVDVVVYTRTHEGKKELIAQHDVLKEAGCRVETRDRERMHEKVVIIDETVLWHGSLNLLSHTGSTDLMMRITSPESCAQVRRIVEQARKDRPARPWPPRGSDSVDDTASAAATPSGSAPAPGVVVNGRLYLKVPFEEKDVAKRSFGADWDKKLKLWHVDAATAQIDQLRRWLPPGTP